MALKWNPELETGIESIDEQHRKAYSVLNELLEAVKARREKEVILGFLDFLIDYVARHFSMEESIMEAYGYPGLEDHRANHAEFAEDIAHISASYKKNGHTALITIKLSTCCIRWLREHITHDDKQMAEFLRTAKPVD